MNKDKTYNYVLIFNYTKEELSTLLDALNNAIIALNKIYTAAQFGTDLPKEFDEYFKDKTFEEIDNIVKTRMNILKKHYNLLLLYEGDNINE